MVAKKVLEVEGGYQNHPSDTGNRNSYNGTQKIAWGPGSVVGTNHGISAALYSSLLKREVSVYEMQNLSKVKALQIYKTAFWDRLELSSVENQNLAEIIFDGVVNMASGVRLLQQAINNTGVTIDVDGAYGNQTKSSVKSAYPQELYNEYRRLRIKWYSEQSNSSFRQGWLNRMKKFPELALYSVNIDKEVVVTAQQDNKNSYWWILLLIAATQLK